LIATLSATVVFKDNRGRATVGGSSCIANLDVAFLDVAVEVNRTGEAEEGSAGEQNDGGDIHVAGEA